MASTPLPETLISWGLIAELSLIHTAPLILPFTVGLNATDKVHIFAEASGRPLLHGIAPLAAAEKSPLELRELIVTKPPLLLVTVTVAAALVVPTNWLAKEILGGLKLKGDVGPPLPLPESADSIGLEAAL